MSATSSFHAEWDLVLAIFVATVSITAVDAAMTKERLAQNRPSTVTPSEGVQTIELDRWSLRPLNDNELKRSSPQFQERAHRPEAIERPRAIEVWTKRPLGNVWGNAAPVIILNGERLSTFAVGADHLVAFLPNLR